MTTPEGDSAMKLRIHKTPTCSRCRNHGVVVPIRGHSGHCVWKLCTCSKCTLVTERRKLLAAHKMLRKAESQAAAPEEESKYINAEKCPEPGQSGVSHLDTGHRVEEYTETKSAGKRHLECETSGERRLKTENSGDKHLDTKQSGPTHPDISGLRHPEFGPSLLPSEWMPNLEYYERETTRMYPSYSPMYHYHPFPMRLSLPAPGFRGLPSPAGIPLRGIRPCHPLLDGGDFPHGYFPPVPPFMPPGFLPGIHYLPPPLPANVSIVGEPSRDMSGHESAERLNNKMMPDRSKTFSTEPSTDSTKNLREAASGTSK